MLHYGWGNSAEEEEEILRNIEEYREWQQEKYEEWQERQSPELLELYEEWVLEEDDFGE